MYKKGFTLIEILVVIGILAILAALISGNFIISLKKGRDAKRKTDLEQIQKALEMYYEDKKAYPITDDLDFGSSLTDTVSGKVYMQKIPNDPSGSDYEYDSTDGSDYKLYACLENTQQVLPYAAVLVPPGELSCSHNCLAEDGTTSILCIYGISSTNTTP